ncbi:hypothetical protein Taro_005251 [Colocasia esculenta]|uniref:Senescence regulator n=1 Tax=Colocasia esculenta TaxID=4460 RepID=A0A843TXD3_COLES|nr:hypothetical protein [Colocasia esculenta]
MEEFQESDVLWPEEDMRQRLAYGGGPQQGRRHGPGGSHEGAGAINAREYSAPIAIPISAPASGRHCQSWTLEFARREGNEHDEEGDKEVVPPHVLVARRLGGKMAFSVCTGQGRTLKGRDLSQVRNSILRLTGFLEG